MEVLPPQGSVVQRVWLLMNKEHDCYCSELTLVRPLSL